MVARIQGAALLLLLVGVLAACDLTGGKPATPSDAQSLAETPWCDRAILNFQDAGTTSGTILTKWSQVRDQLGFTPYLPSSLPKGTCLVLAGGSIHDPIYGGRLSVTYDLPQTGPLSFSEAPKRASLSDKVQCTQDVVATPEGGSTSNASTTPAAAPAATPTAVPATTICLGTIGKTTISIATRQSTADVQKLFAALQPSLDWVPASADTPVPTVTSTPTKH